jgi:nucleoside-diphosphate-sugar epimerase
MSAQLPSGTLSFFITGANGCIGHVLVKSLSKSRSKITALALDYADTNRIKDIKNINIFLGNICDRKRMEEIFAVSNFDVVIHLAAIVHEKNVKKPDYMKVNYEATKDLFDLAKDYRVKQFIFLSSVAVYGDETSRIQKEEDLISPASAYASAKAKSEEYLIEKSGDIAYTIIRPTTVYGKYDRGNIHKLFTLTKKRIIPLIGSGTNLKSLVYVDNLVDGIQKTILNPNAYNQIFIISDKEPYSVNKILQEMEKIRGKNIWIIHFPSRTIFFMLKVVNKTLNSLSVPSPFNNASLKKLETDNIFDISKAKEFLGYEPRFTLETGLRRTYFKEINV